MSCDRLYVDLVRDTWGERAKDAEVARVYRDRLEQYRHDNATPEEEQAEEKGGLIDEVCDLIALSKSTIVEALQRYNRLCAQSEACADLVKTLQSAAHNVRKQIDVALYLIETDKEEKTKTPTLDVNELREHADSIAFAIDGTCGMVRQHRDKVEASMSRHATLLRRMRDAYGILKPAHGCPVCMNRDVNMYCDPCGHCFCDRCILGAWCYVCRADIKRVRPIHFC